MPLNFLNTGYFAAKVGIGNDNPHAPLSIYTPDATLGSSIAIQNNVSGTGSGQGFYLGISTGIEAYVWNYEDADLVFAANNLEGMRLASGGAVKFAAYGAGVLVTDASGNITATTSPPVDGITFNNGATITNQINTDVDIGTETIASVAIATHDSAFFDFVIKKLLNVRSGTVYACHDGDTTPLVVFTETSTQDLGDTSDVTLSVVISGTNMELQATTTSDNWSIKSLIRAI